MNIRKVPASREMANERGWDRKANERDLGCVHEGVSRRTQTNENVDHRTLTQE